MDASKNSPVLVDALSPSRITDYFSSSKIKTRGKNEKTKKSSSKASVYLTPESSPGTDYNTRESDEIAQHMHPDNDDCNTENPKADLTDKTTTSKPDVLTDSLISSLPHVIDSFKSFPSCPDTDPNSCSDNIEQTQPCNDQKAIPDNAEAIQPEAENSQNKHKLASAKERSITMTGTPAEAITISPSCPRPKLRKGAKSMSKTDAIGTENEPVKPKPGRRKKKEPEPVQKNVITDFFPVRRSGRVTKSEIEKEKQHQLEQQIMSSCEDGLQITEFENKGRGVIATKEFQKGDFVVEYAGDLIDTTTARQREKDYSANPQIGCYMYFFSVGIKQYCVDATAESGRLGRLINHSREGNLCTKAVMVKGQPHLILVASRTIRAGEELSYDYGDRSKAALEAHPWLKS